MFKPNRTFAGCSAFVLLFCLASSLVYSQNAQTGRVKGRVIDNTTGEPQIGVTIIHRASGKFSVTDINGEYVLNGLPTGEQTIEFQLSGYGVQERSVQVRPGGLSTLNVSLKLPTQTEVVVRERALTNTSAALISKRKKAASSQDAISSEQISKSTDTSASEAAKRVTGISIVGGKFVFVRGLGERYSSVLFNGAYLPSPEPDRRVIPLDIFPTSLLDSLIISKTYTADMPGDFSGGVVGINSKSYPEEQTLEVKLKSGYNSITTFQDFKTYEGSGLDFLGIASLSDKRDLPAGLGKGKVVPLSDSDIREITEQFDNIWEIENITGRPPLSLTVSYGNTYQFSDNSKLGIIATGLFRQSSQNIDQKRTIFTTVGEMDSESDIESSDYSTSKGGLISLNYNFNSFHQIGINTLYNHTSSDTTSRAFRTSLADLPRRIENLNYIENSLLFNQFHGESFFKKFFRSKLTWKASYSRAVRNEPDRRRATYEQPLGRSYQPDQFVREYNGHAGNLIHPETTLEIPYEQWDSLPAKFEMGVAYFYRFRDSDNRRFTWLLANENALPGGIKNLPSEDFFDALIEQDRFDAINLREDTTLFDSYSGRHNLIAGFLQTDLPLLRELRLVAGVRVEHSTLSTKSQNPFSQGEEVEGKIERTDPIPAASLIYNMTKDVILRTSYSYTLTRPDFKEISVFRTPDVVTGEEFRGNPFLEQTNIHNVDFRMEWYTDVLELLSLSFFYKRLNRPVELILLASATDIITFFNADKADNLGVELEVKQDLDFLMPASWGLFSVNINFSWIHSEITLPEEILYYEAGNSNPEVRRSSGTVNEDRPLQGQSPYVMNAILNYEHEKAGSLLSVSFNIAGRYITRVGLKGFSNEIYQEPVPQLDLAFRQNITEGFSIKLFGQNILDPTITETTDLVAGSRERKNTREFKRGITLALQGQYVF